MADTSIRDGYEMAKKLEDLVKSDAEVSAAAAQGQVGSQAQAAGADSASE